MCASDGFVPISFLATMTPNPRRFGQGNFMKAYVMTTGSVFALLVVAHVWRVIEEGSHVARDPWYVLSTAVAAALCLWAWRVLRLMPR